MIGDVWVMECAIYVLVSCFDWNYRCGRKGRRRHHRQEVLFQCVVLVPLQFVWWMKSYVVESLGLSSPIPLLVVKLAEEWLSPEGHPE
ncbi:uncharacterized protein LACBIDRAFT_296662 [Laccaria bicolor S238N-H82]|uniref:Predicted protein n=1 Tax=Laccaria bicolor (strain S238N-H82 / ATCC MYA-4686) TaxID=486041 RepID=B0D9D3_LACBS|nr:uncharacterized protein LACBIDRAFT_296662 [Laccaria bicolor S238N-H82]EDR08998.1 predicted protein [Laccaria bicolor S238N-H82]|eukprot:XP_001880311.1 predicted protein [Laccaria bicolor S238N-H82]